MGNVQNQGSFICPKSGYQFHMLKSRTLLENRDKGKRAFSKADGGRLRRTNERQPRSPTEGQLEFVKQTERATARANGMKWEKCASRRELSEGESPKRELTLGRNRGRPMQYAQGLGAGFWKLEERNKTKCEQCWERKPKAFGRSVQHKHSWLTETQIEWRI